MRSDARRRAGVEDGVDVETVVAVEVRQVAGLAEMLDAERARGGRARRRARTGVAGWPSMSVHEPASGASGASELLHMGDRVAMAGLAGALGRVPAGVQAVGRGHGEQAGAGIFVEDLAVRLDRLGGDRAGVDARRGGAPGAGGCSQ